MQPCDKMPLPAGRPCTYTPAMPRNTRFCLALTLLLAACGEDEIPISIAFAGQVGDSPATCGATYPNIGTTNGDYTLRDFRLFVHDVRLVNDAGIEHAVALAQDGEYQLEDIALLDFETGGAGCPGGSVGTHTRIRGTIPEGTYTELRFRVGIPFIRNHANAAEAPAPLNNTAMFWNWQGGYKFIRIDGASAVLPDGFVVHLGSTACDGDRLTGGTTVCANANVPTVSFPAFNPAVDTVVVDLQELFRGSNIDIDNGEQAGCQSRPADPECGPVFERLGLPFGENSAVTQSVFRVDRSL